MVTEGFSDWFWIRFYRYLERQGKEIIKDYPLIKQITDSIAPTDSCNARQMRNKLHAKTAGLSEGSTVINRQPPTPRTHILVHNTLAPNNNSTEQDQSYKNDLTVAFTILKIKLRQCWMILFYCQITDRKCHKWPNATPLYGFSSYQCYQ